MTHPTASDTDAMRSILARLQNAPIDPIETVTASKSTKAPLNESIHSSTGNPDVDTMKNILSSFYSVVEPEDVGKAPASTPIMESKVATPVKSSNWEVKSKLTESSSRTTYDIVNSDTKEVFVENLILPDAALALVKYLNKGVDAKSERVQEVIALEENFNRSYADTQSFKKLYERCRRADEKEAGAIFAAKHQSARANAIAAKTQVKNILDSIR